MIISAATSKGENIAGFDVLVVDGTDVDFITLFFVLVEFALVKVGVFDAQGLAGIVLDLKLDPVAVTHGCKVKWISLVNRYGVAKTTCD